VHDGLRAARQRDLRGHPGIAHSRPDLDGNAPHQLQPRQPDEEGKHLHDREDVELVGEHGQPGHAVRDRHPENPYQAQRNTHGQCEQDNDGDDAGRHVAR
jgi:hypothetical protein